MEFYKLVEVMKKLRGPDGCPWDKEQTLETLKKTLLEETYEVLEVMEEKNHEELKGELGDLLLQIVFQSEIMEEKNYFSIDDVCREITEKLIRRHPHIFGDIEVKDSEEVLTNWEEIKKLEKAHKHRESVLDGIPKALPPLEKAYKIQSKIKKFEIEPSNIQESLNRIDSLYEDFKKNINENNEEKIKNKYGEILFAMTNFAKLSNFDASEELRKVIKEFEKNFREKEMYINKNKRGE